MHGAHLTEDRFDGGLPAGLCRPTFPGSPFAGHALLAVRGLGDPPGDAAGGSPWHRCPVTGPTPARDIELDALFGGELGGPVRVVGRVVVGVGEDLPGVRRRLFGHRHQIAGIDGICVHVGGRDP